MHKFLGGDEIPLNFFVINGYLYQGMLLGPKETLRYTWMTLTQTIQILKGGIRVWQAARENFSRAVSQWGAEPIEALTSSQLLAGAQELFIEAARYYTAVQSSTLPTATSSETLFTKFYEGLVKGRDDPKAANFLVGFETIPIRAEKSLFDLASWCRQRPALQEYIQGNSSRQVAHALQNSESPAGLSTEDWSGLRQRLHAHFDTFGHTVYDFDFTNPMPAEDP